MAGIDTAPGGAVLAEDVRDFQLGTGHCRRRLSRRLLPPALGHPRLAALDLPLPTSLSIGLASAAMMAVATRV
jgi:hypothetical protein